MALNSEERSRLIDAYASGPGRLRAALAAVPEEALQWKPAPSEFSVHQVVQHCADATAVGYARIRFLVAEKDPPIQGWNEELWAAELDYHRFPIAPALATVEATVANTLPLVKVLPAEAWARTGTHSGAGVWSIDNWLEQQGSHLEMHAGQIEAIHSAWQARSGR